MGLFSRWTTGREANTAEEAQTEAPKAEVREEAKSAADTGRERVAKMCDGMKETWKKWVPKLRDGGNWLLGKVADLGLGALGGAEKGAKKAGAAIEAGSESVSEFVAESRQEAGELASSFGDWAEGAATELGSGVEATIDGLNDWAQKNVDAYQLAKEAAQTELNDGVIALNNWAQARIDQWNKFKTNVDNTPVDIKKAWANLKAEVAAGISERFGLLKEGARSDYARASAQASQRRDTFRGWVNRTRMELAGTAELKGEVAELKEKLARQNRLTEQLLKLQTTSAEASADQAAENNEVVQMNS
jgi:uncharacterized phage infection (PIP) family protein YhgE